MYPDNIRQFIDPRAMAEPMAVTEARAEGYKIGRDVGYREGVLSASTILTAAAIMVAIIRKVL